MAQPRLQLRRGTQSPSAANITTALTGEPFFDSTGDNLYIADSANTFVHVGGASYTSRVDSFLTNNTASDPSIITLKEATGSGSNIITLKSPATLGSNVTFQLPDSNGTSGYVLQTDGSGNTTWVAQTSGYTKWVLTDGTTSQDIENTNTVTFSGSGGITTAVSATDTLTISLNIDGLNAQSSIADTDTFAFYDVSASGNRKATADDVRDYVLGGVSGHITIDSSGVATIKNTSNLTGGTIIGWNSSNTQFENSPLTYSGSDVAVTGDLTVTGNDIKSSGGTTAITLSGANVTIAGDLTVSGTNTSLNTTTLKVEDRIIELGLVNGTAPDAASSWDTAIAFNYHATTAKKAALVWIDNAGFELAATITETSDTGNADPQITVDSRAKLGINALYIGSISTSTNEVIDSNKNLLNVTIDCGTY